MGHECRVCGAVSLDDDFFCHNCGAALFPVEAEEQVAPVMVPEANDEPPASYPAGTGAAYRRVTGPVLLRGAISSPDRPLGKIDPVALPIDRSARPGRRGKSPRFTAWAVLGLVLFIAASSVGLYFISQPRLKVIKSTVTIPEPPGYTAASSEDLQQYGVELQAGTPDYLYFTDSKQSVLAIIHQTYGIILGDLSEDIPETRDLREMQDYLTTEASELLLFGIVLDVAVAYDMNMENMAVNIPTILSTSPVELATGDVGMQLVTRYDLSDGTSLEEHDLVVAKGGNLYTAAVIKPAGSDFAAELNWLRENLSL